MEAVIQRRADLKPGIPPHVLTDTTGEDTDRAVHEESANGNHGTENQELRQHGMARIDELRQEGQDEQDHLGICQIHDQTIPEGARGAHRQVRRSLTVGGVVSVRQASQSR